jgi:hypothetical protein
MRDLSIRRSHCHTHFLTSSPREVVGAPAKQEEDLRGRRVT